MWGRRRPAGRRRTTACRRPSQGKVCIFILSRGRGRSRREGFGGERPAGDENTGENCLPPLDSRCFCVIIAAKKAEKETQPRRGAQRGVPWAVSTLRGNTVIPLPSRPPNPRGAVDRTGPSRYRGHERRINSASRVEPWSKEICFTPELSSGGKLFVLPPDKEEFCHARRKPVHL